jgi:ribosome-associated protein
MSPLEIPDWELDWSYARSSGPGGQNVNKVNSKAVLRWNAWRTSCVSFEKKERLIARLAGRLTSDGCVVIASDRFRDQPRNREDCLEKLYELLEWALHEPKARKKTKQSFSSRKRDSDSKKRDSRKKSLRGKVRDY